MSEVLSVGRIVSLQVGMPRRLTTATGRAWESAIVKEKVLGSVALGEENLAGDYQANRKYHGGPDKAICAYSAEHYPDWNSFLGYDLGYGAFGENITIEGLTEDRLCIGDTLEIDGVALQISQPRQPCASISKRWSAPKLPRRMEETGWTGFYCRVLVTGDLRSDAEIHVTSRPNPDWTLLRANQVMYGDASISGPEIDALRALALLSAEWKRILGRKLRPASS